MGTTGLQKKYIELNVINQEIISLANEPDIYFHIEKIKKLQETYPHLKNSPNIICVIDILTQEYLFVSDNIVAILGHEPRDIYHEGFNKTFSLFPPNQLKIILDKIFPTMFIFFNQHAQQGTLFDLKISFSSLMTHKNGSQRWYLNQLTVIRLNKNDKPHWLLKQVTDIHDFKNDNSITFVIAQKNQNGIYRNIHKESFLCDEESINLTEREIEILHLMSQGYSSREISEALFISLHTVYKHRKNMLKKMDVKRTGDLIKAALKAGLI
jgi:DNA-binding CsgD family transcriptional regulator